jgi:hypothetical protein
MTTFQVPTLHCERCGWQWVPRQAEVRMCPHCKSLYWNVPKEEKPPLPAQNDSSLKIQHAQTIPS